MSLPVLTLLALVPVAALLAALVWSDRNREPLRVVVITLLLGALTPIPIIVVGVALAGLLGIPTSDPATLGQAIAISFVLAALVEETFKFAVLWGYSARHDAFDEPFDGIVYGTAASLGFAASENLMYVFGQPTAGGSFLVGTLRAFTAVPMHALCGVVMGLCIGIARFTPSARILWLGLGLVGAIGLHGTYNSFVFGTGVMTTQGRDGFAALSAGGVLATLLLAAGTCLLAIARFRRDQLRVVVTNLPPGASPPPRTESFVRPLPPPPPRIAVPPPPPVVVSPPVLPMVAMVLVAIASAFAVGFLFLAMLASGTPEDGISEATGLMACGLMVLCGGLGLAGAVAATVALVRRDRWTGASIASGAVGALLVTLVAAVVVAAALA